MTTTPMMMPLESRTLLSADYTATIAVADGIYTRGEQVPITVTVKNSGTSGTIFPSRHVVVLSRDEQYGNADDIEVSVFSSAGLLRGQTQTHSTAALLGSALPAGSYYVAVKLDQLNSVNESNESNVFFTEDPGIVLASNDLPAGPVTGTAGNDVILLQQRRGRLVVTVNGVARAGVVPPSLFVDAGAGNDKLIADASVTLRLQATGSGGADTIAGGSGVDELSGGSGKDRVYGGAGNDFLLGGSQNDYLSGEAGNDRMSGGGGNDRLADGTGKDYFLGGLGNDVLLSRDTTNDATHGPDTLSGNAGSDRAQVDTGAFADLHTGVEDLIA